MAQFWGQKSDEKSSINLSNTDVYICRREIHKVVQQNFVHEIVLRAHSGLRIIQVSISQNGNFLMITWKIQYKL